MENKDFKLDPKPIAAALKQAHKEWVALSDEEKKRLEAEVESSRFWEDFTDEDFTLESDEI